MKKLFVILLTLWVLALSLCLSVAADTTEATTEAITEATTEEETMICTCPNCVTEEETTATADPVFQFGLYPSTLLETLPVMGMGMLGIFLVTLVIVLATVLLSRLGRGKKDEE